MARHLWSLGLILIALGIAALVVGWDTLLWFPVRALDALWWVPEALADAYHAAPLTFVVIGLGICLLVLARILMARRRN